MSEYGLRVKKGDFEMSLNTDDAPWIAQEITLWREALLSGQLARALSTSAIGAGAAPLTRAPGFVPKAQSDLTSMAQSTHSSPATVFVTQDAADPEETHESAEGSGFDEVFTALLDESDAADTLPSSPLLEDADPPPPDDPDPDALPPRFAAVSTATRRGKTSPPVATTFESWCDTVPPTCSVQSLLWASAYLMEQDQQIRFSLKDINRLLAEAALATVNHTTLQEALDENLIELVQDVDDVTHISEYQLTQHGVDTTRRARKVKAKPTAKSRKPA